jgi:hypothetical protein
VALSTGLALAQSASATAGGSSKAGGPSATAGATGASKSGTTTGGMSARLRPRHHRKHSELSGLQFAQGGAPSGRGAITGDPAASSATPGAAPTTGNSMKSNPSGKDDNGDQGRDKMPESNKAVRPDNKPGKM